MVGDPPHKEKNMPEKVVTLRIDANAKEVTFEGERGLAFPNTFRVSPGDSVKWVLQGVPTGAAARVRFVRSTNEGEATLFERGNTFEADGVVINSGPVDANASDGEYRYEIDLVTPNGATKLECVWSDSATTKRAEMAGGEKSGGRKQSVTSGPGGP